MLRRVRKTAALLKPLGPVVVCIEGGAVNAYVVRVAPNYVAIEWQVFAPGLVAALLDSSDGDITLRSTIAPIPNSRRRHRIAA